MFGMYKFLAFLGAESGIGVPFYKVHECEGFLTPNLPVGATQWQDPTPISLLPICQSPTVL